MADKTDKTPPAAAPAPPAAPAGAAPPAVAAPTAVPAKVKPVKVAGVPQPVKQASGRALAVRNGKGFVTFTKKGTKIKAPAKPQEPFPGTAEFHAAKLGTPKWKLAAARAHMRWPPFGAVCSEDEFKKAVEAASNVKINAR